LVIKLKLKKLKLKKQKFKKLIIVLSILIVSVLGIAIYIQATPKVVDNIIVEAGTETVDVSGFLINKDDNGVLLTDIDTLDMMKPGDHEVEIEINNKTYTSIIKVVDTIAPRATPINQMIAKGDTIAAEAFVSEIIDATEVKVYYDRPPLEVVGEQELTIILEDSSGNKSELIAKLTILDIADEVNIEAGSFNNLTIQDFISDGNYEAKLETDLSKIDFNKTGSYEIGINVDGKSFLSHLNLVDTTPPKAIDVNVEIWQGETVEASSFVRDIEDISAVNISYEKIPDFSLVGEQTVDIILADEFGNTTQLQSLLTTKEDKEPPTIYGVNDKTIYIGEALSFRAGIKARDNKDGEIDYKVDSSKVNLKKKGTYNVLYTATDTSGNTATKTSVITVKELIITEEMVSKLCKDILASITSEDMTKREIARKIYDWVKGHVSYSGSSDKSDWLKEAYKAINKGVGDCFTYFAVSQALLNEAGIENMKVTRVGGKTQHFWNLINCGDGWYHFDTCPTKDKIDTFMLTDAEVEAYTEYRQNNYYNFDKSLYPRTPEE